MNMTEERARKIFKEWQKFTEINDKLALIFSTSIPESFLPYRVEEIEEALNIVAESYFNAGQKENSKKIQESIVNLWVYNPDEEALKDMKKRLELILNDTSLKKTLLAKLNEFFESWRSFKNDGTL